MKQLTTDAIILKRLNFSEADRILTVITPEQGRLSLLAKGVRKQKSKLAGGLELFSISSITYIDGRSELKTIISTKLIKHFGNVVKDIKKTMLLYDFMKALDITTQHGVESGVYELLESILAYLDGDSVDINLATIWFSYKLLKIDGRAANIEKPLNENKFNDVDYYDFSYEDMGFFANKNGQLRPNTIKFLRLLDRSDRPEKLHVIDDYDELSGKLAPIFNNLLKMHKA